jgi:hypothetical protein
MVHLQAPGKRAFQRRFHRIKSNITCPLKTQISALILYLECTARLCPVFFFNYNKTSQTAGKAETVVPTSSWESRNSGALSHARPRSPCVAQLGAELTDLVKAMLLSSMIRSFSQWSFARHIGVPPELGAAGVWGSAGEWGGVYVGLRILTCVSTGQALHRSQRLQPLCVLWLQLLHIDLGTRSLQAIAGRVTNYLALSSLCSLSCPQEFTAHTCKVKHDGHRVCNNQSRQT